LANLSEFHCVQVSSTQDASTVELTYTLWNSLKLAEFHFHTSRHSSKDLILPRGNIRLSSQHGRPRGK
jgi:hypothetical protein